MENLLSVARKTKMYFRVNQGLKTPLVLMYFITNKCNMRCKHCFYWQDLNIASKTPSLQLAEIEKIACSFKSPLANLIITGGEPFLASNLTEVCKIFYEKNHTLNFYLLTNGYLTDKITESVDEILRFAQNDKKETQNDKRLSANLHLQVSLDGLEEEHDKIRNTKRSFKNAVNTLNELKILTAKHSNLNTYILTVLSKWNIKELKDLSEFAIHKLEIPITFEFARGNVLFKNNPVLSANYNPGMPEETLLTYPEMINTYKTVKDIYSIQKKKFKSDFDLSLLGLQKGLEVIRNNHKIVNCVAGNSFAVMYSDGNVSGCELINSKISIREFELDFYKLWQSEEMKSFRKKIKNCYCTLGCFLQASLENSLRYGLFGH